MFVIFSAPNTIFRKYCISIPGPYGLEAGGIFVTKLFLESAKVLSGIHLNTWKYNVCSIKHEVNVLRLH